MSLRSSILEDNSIVHEFITKSLSVLQHIPNDETSIISTSLKYQKIVEDLPWVRLKRMIIIQIFYFLIVYNHVLGR